METISSLHFYGDSLTAGYGAAPADGWIPRLSKRFPALTLYNHGALGAGLTDILGDAETLLAYPAPGEALCLMGGTNDLLCGRKEDALFAEMENAVRNLSRKIPILLGVPPLTTPQSVVTGWQAEWQYETTNAALTRYAVFLRNLSGELSLPLLDFQAHFPSDDRYYADGLHPNAEGYQIFADLAEKEIKKFLEKK